MTFITGSITNANPGPALYTVIETAALADGWTLADTVIIGGNTHKVLKSAAAGNVQALDWYLDINYPTTGIAGGIRFAPFEGYNATTHVATNGPYSAASTTVNATGYSAFGSTASALETNWYNTGSISGISTTLTTTTFTYYISITRNRILVNLTSQPTSINYGGFYTPSVAHVAAAGASLFPLIATRITSPSNTLDFTLSSAGSGSGAMFTRAPLAPTGSWFSWSTSCSVLTGLGAAIGAGQIGGSGASPFTANQSAGSIPIVMGSIDYGNSYTNVGTKASATVGTLTDVAATLAGATATVGNTVTIGSDTWYTTTNASGGALIMRAI